MAPTHAVPGLFLSDAEQTPATEVVHAEHGAVETGGAQCVEAAPAVGRLHPLCAEDNPRLLRHPAATAQRTASQVGPPFDV